MSFFNKKFKNLRLQNNLTLERFSSESGVPLAAVKSFEARNTEPDILNLKKISAFYGLSIDHIISGKSKYIKNINYFLLAEKVDLLSLSQINKIDNYIDAFLDLRKKIIRIYDKTDLKLCDNFNKNFKLLTGQSNQTGKKIAESLDITLNQYNSYKRETFCSLATLKKMSTYFKVSCHYFVTGKKLHFNFRNREFEENSLKADSYLDSKYINMSIEYMKQILRQNGKLPA